MTLRFAAPLVALLLSSTAVVHAAVNEPKPRLDQREARVAAQDLPVIEIKHEKIVLPNGLTLIVHEDHNTPIVSVGIWYHVGSANEAPGRTGFAHLFEHLLFNGSEHADTDWFKSMNSLGATNMNGTTGFDRTNYYETVPKNALDRLLWLESDRMQNLLPAVDQAKLDEQRKVVQNEKRQRANNPLGELPDMLHAAIYPEGHPYSWLPIGSMEDLNAATLDDVRAYFKKWYGPNNAVLVLSGDITIAEAREKVMHYFGDIPAGPAIMRHTQQIAPRTGESRGIFEADTANSQLLKVWNIPGWASRETQLLSIAASALASGEHSRLQRRLVRDLKLATEVRADVSALELGSQFTVSATALSGVSLEQLEAAIDEEVAGFLRDGPTEAELDRVQFQQYALYVRSQPLTAWKAQMLAESELYAGSSDHYRKDQETTYAATPAKVAETARKWLSDGAYVLEVRAQPKHTVTGKPVDRSTAPPIGPAPAFSLPPLQHATLSNGIRIALAERHDVPTVNLSMVFDVGSVPDRNPASIGLSWATGLTTLGTRTRSKIDISREMDELGAMIGWQGSQETGRFSVNALKLKLDATLDLYADILLNPTFPADEWARQRDQFIAQYEDMKRTPEGKLAQTLGKMIYGPDHPYAAQMTPAIAKRVTVDDFQHFYEQWYRPDLATIFVAGDTTLAEIMPKLEQRLAGWRARAGSSPTKPPLPPVARPATPRVVLIDQPGAASSVIFVSHVTVARNDPDFEARNVAGTVLGGHFISRLNMNLREDKGWSYGAKSAVEGGKLLGTASAITTVQTDKTVDALREISRELREIGTTRPPTADEITAARNSMLLGLPATLQGSAGSLSKYREAYELGLPEDYWNGYVQRIQGLTTEQVGAAAKRLFPASELTWFVVGDLATVEADIRKLGLGEVMVYNGDGDRVR